MLIKQQAMVIYKTGIPYIKPTIMNDSGNVININF